jgi:hypothetical protein
MATGRKPGSQETGGGQDVRREPLGSTTRIIPKDPSTATRLAQSPLKDPGSATRVQPSPKDAGSTTRVTGATRNISPKTIEIGRSFLSALFMGLRTAQIHDPANKAFERAVQGLRVSAEALYAATGGFAISFVEDSTFLNGVRLRFEGGQFDSMRTLRHILESKELGGLEMRAPPSYDAIRKLLLMFSMTGTAVEVSRDDLLAAQIGVLGVQRFSDASQDRFRVDRRVFAVQSYAKLLLAFREHRDTSGEGDRPVHAPRLRAVRIVQDLVELCGDRSDFLLRLGSNHFGANVDELHAANVCVLSIALAHAIGLERQDMVDIGVAGLFHDVSRSDGEEPPPLPRSIAPGSPVAYDGELMPADGWGDSGRPLELGAGASANPGNDNTTLDDDDDPVPLPVEYIGELTPLDPSERDSPGDVDLHGTDDLLTPSELDAAGEEVERTAVGPAPVPDTGDIDVASEEPPDEIEIIPLGQGGPREAPGHPGHPEEAWDATEHPHALASFARLLMVGAMSRSGLLRAIVAAEHHLLGAERYRWGEMRGENHLYSRIVAVVDAYDALTSGLGSPDGMPMHPLDALEVLAADRTGRVDPRMVDLLINVLRAYPVGTQVLLDTGERAVVTSHAGGTRWDRPVIRTLTDPPRIVDLMLRERDRFQSRIVSTVRAVGERDA